MSRADAAPAPLLIGISACLLGERVRYDGDHKLDRDLIAGLESRVRWAPLCPEVEAGFGIPRPPMRLELDRDRVRLVGVGDRRDRTEAMVRCAQTWMARLARAGIAGFILKSRSPSCGPGDAPTFAHVHGDAGMPVRTGAHVGVRDGLFAEALRTAMPGLPLVSGEDLATPACRDTFLAAAADYLRGQAPE